MSVSNARQHSKANYVKVVEGRHIEAPLCRRRRR